ncbi:MAG: hypothetical protein QM648_03445 [Solirubrobacterales bacterium]
MIPKPREDRRALHAAAMLLGLAVLALLQLRAALELAPAVLLAAILYLGYRPGEKLVERIHERRRRRRSRRPGRLFTPRIRPMRVAVVIDRLAASDLAMRPPPALRSC